MKKILLVLLLVIGSVLDIFAIIPPAKGVAVPSFFKQKKEEIEKSYESGYYAQRMAQRRELTEKLGSDKSITVADSVHVLTLFGAYSDYNNYYGISTFQEHLFDGPNSSGTIPDYYTQVSYGKMHMSGTCKGWYKVAGTMASYVGSDNGLGSSGGPKFVLDVITKADAEIDYSQYIQYYDASNNPHIGFVAVVHTGADAAAGANNIWSHRWNFTIANGGRSYTTNDTDPISGKKVIIDGDYAIEPELKGSSNSSGAIIDIGVFCHEFGHIFGLPDLYDTDYTSEGVGLWCLMAGGSYGGNGQTADTPVQMSAWCKLFLGWVTPTVVTTGVKDLVLPTTERNPYIVKIWKKNGVNAKEYYLAENRQKLLNDRNLPGPGLVIYHIDDSQSGNSNENRYKVDVEQADGKRDLNLNVNQGDAGDPFPGSTLNRIYDYTSLPNSNSYTTGVTYVSVRDIKMNDTVVTATFDAGTQPYIKGVTATASRNSGTGRVQPGDFVDVTLRVKNLEVTAAANSTINFSIDDPQVQVLQPSITATIAGFADTTLQVNRLLKIDAAMTPKMVWLRYKITSSFNTYTDSARFVIGVPSVLVWSKAEKSTLISYYDTSLALAGKIFELANNTETPQYLSSRKSLVILTGATADSLFTQAEIDSLTAFLNNGGNIFFSGQALAEYLQVNYPDFLQQTIGVNWVKNETVFIQRAYGIAGDLFGSNLALLRFNGANGAANEKLVDVIAPVSSDFHLSLSYKTASVEGAGGWRVKSSGGKIFFLGFGFESINNVESSVTRTGLIQSIINWFDNLSDVKNEPNDVKSYSLAQNYPNPFNPTTTIEYNVAVGGKVKLAVYDLLGKEVSVLVDTEKPMGSYKVSFNASNLPSGVYFYKLTANGFTDTKKLMLLK